MRETTRPLPPSTRRRPSSALSPSFCCFSVLISVIGKNHACLCLRNRENQFELGVNTPCTRPPPLPCAWAQLPNTAWPVFRLTVSWQPRITSLPFFSTTLPVISTVRG